MAARMFPAVREVAPQALLQHISAISVASLDFSLSMFSHANHARPALQQHSAQAAEACVVQLTCALQ